MNRSPKTESHNHMMMNYVVGFVLSLVLTLIPYWLVTSVQLPTASIVGLIMFFAIAQLGVQAYFFMHLGEESKPRWNLWTFLFMLLVVSIVVGGSVWIMANLDYNMMHTMPTTELRDQKGF